MYKSMNINIKFMENFINILSKLLIFSYKYQKLRKELIYFFSKIILSFKL